MQYQIAIAIRVQCVSCLEEITFKKLAWRAIQIAYLKKLQY